MYETIKTELKEGILTLTLNRPDQMNAYTEKMNEELLDFYKNVNSDDAVRVIVVTGSGRAFCAGMDLSEGGSTFSSEQPAEDYRDLGGQVSLQVYEVNKPIIAAINGPAVGIGMTMTLPMDIRIVKKDAKIGFVFGRRDRPGSQFRLVLAAACRHRESVGMDVDWPVHPDRRSRQQRTGSI
ncbi:enoyl-CoA hydratase-related protein [Planococcus sp. 107-1]|uniref:enoyl-CoA hydratase-related protein n=1 Tax=Planococcus sp. 107-1 TaxID=2908840 RepID=UPI0021A5C117|nr:enoyl-CoA hydratase-related protein [Planococcus sp. 107-1]